MRRMTQLAVVAALVGVFALPMVAQDVASGAAAKPEMMAKDADPDWEVVTVKPSAP